MKTPTKATGGKLYVSTRHTIPIQIATTGGISHLVGSICGLSHAQALENAKKIVRAWNNFDELLAAHKSAVDLLVNDHYESAKDWEELIAECEEIKS